MSLPAYGKSVSNWNPGSGPMADCKRVNQLMSTEAADAPDTVNGVNKLEAWRGKGGKPPEPYGQKGTDF